MENRTDEGEDEEEEEVIVYANFEEGTVDRDIFLQFDLKFKMIGLDSDTPILQLGDTTFKGVWTDTIGTKVIFEEDASPSEPVDPVFTVIPPKMLKYKCMSTKTLELSRIFLKPKISTNSVQSSERTELPDDRESFSEHENEILKVVGNVAPPDANTDAIMKDIVKQSTVNVLDDNNLSGVND